MNDRVTRREFLRLSAGVAAAVGLPSALSTRVFAQGGEQERIRLGFIGVAGRGSALMGEFMQHEDVTVTAVCDAYRPHLEAAVARTGGQAMAYQDFRNLLEDDNVDAVVIASPPHWHALMTVLACQAGKDVYCEKPMCLYPGEARAMRRAAAEYGRVTQVGTQIHAEENFQRVVELIRAGYIGDISIVHTFFTHNLAPEGMGFIPDSDVPEGLDWDMWLGPAPLVPFNEGRFRGGMYRCFRDYVGSWLHEMGPHILELPFTALELGPPTAVSSAGGKYLTNDMSEIPDTMESLFEYPDRVVAWHQHSANSYNFGFGPPPDTGRRLSIRFCGLRATLVADYGSREVIPEGDRMDGVEEPEPFMRRSPGHAREFLDCIRTRQEPGCSVQRMYAAHIAMNLGNLSYYLGRKLRWDEATGHVLDDPEADRLAQAVYRDPWKLPV